MQHNFIRNLLDLKGVIVKKVRYKINYHEQKGNTLNIQENCFYQDMKT